MQGGGGDDLIYYVFLTPLQFLELKSAHKLSFRRCKRDLRGSHTKREKGSI